ncbi:hypothetical protein HH214_20190 [Mucilaginibacter robiniae]|uniref:Uncharacterized protein n=1 Tax=Mucilaginibacter robiniae TaxID=2728022 RepID=A0A7L5E6R7_9SPHI|nr:hypothetical protein [Mucilaginibacter robiniae]QJD98029.1 hypothetical protein HH214_20190 [Mucilaginibacter robiniae]
MSHYRHLHKYIVLFSIICLSIACHRRMPAPPPLPPKPELLISFKSIEGKEYTEVKRVFNTGYVFDSGGYELVPLWKITFLPDDSVRIYSPKLQKYVICPVTIDHGSVASIAWSWVRVLKQTPDSLLFRVLNVSSQHVHETKPYVLMTLYRNDYIKNTLHTTAEKLMRHRSKDSVFVQNLVKQANADYKQIFGATEPAVFTSISPNLQVKRIHAKVDRLNGVFEEDDYLSPNYEITIHKAYADFDYYMLVMVDEKGKLHFMKSINNLFADVEYKLKAMKSITEDGYLSFYMKAAPGKTWGMPHASPVMIRVKGVKG